MLFINIYKIRDNSFLVVSNITALIYTSMFQFFADFNRYSATLKEKESDLTFLTMFLYFWEIFREGLITLLSSKAAITLSDLA